MNSYHTIGGVINDYCFRGKLFLITNKTLKYRQHRHNIIGKNVGFLDKLKRLNSFFLAITKIGAKLILKFA